MWTGTIEGKMYFMSHRHVGTQAHKQYILVTINICHKKNLAQFDFYILYFFRKQKSLFLFREEQSFSLAAYVWPPKQQRETRDQIMPGSPAEWAPSIAACCYHHMP